MIGLVHTRVQHLTYSADTRERRTSRPPVTDLRVSQTFDGLMPGHNPADGPDIWCRDASPHRILCPSPGFVRLGSPGPQLMSVLTRVLEFVA